MLRRLFLIGLSAALVALTVLAVSPKDLSGAAAPARPGASNKSKPKVEVVFCLDTTGSMGGLIDGAKAKIWAICNQIAGGKPTPDLKVGLVAYRDKGDAYVTKVFDLTNDLDAVYANLKTFQAQGGGDTPEHVNQALFDSVHKIGWSKEAKTLRIVFLVGDAPPHMDYPEDVKYPVTCKKACEMGIIINTIQCGPDAECRKHWQEIAKKAEGSYVQISATGGVVAVATPFDAELAKINTKLATSTVVYGTPTMRAEGKGKVEEAKALKEPDAAERAGFSGKVGGVATYDLIDAIKAKRVKLEDLKEKDLPEQLAKLKTVGERQACLDKISKERAELSSRAVDLDKRRSAFIAQELAKKGKGRDSFDNQVLEMLRRQARKHGIDY